MVSRPQIIKTANAKSPIQQIIEMANWGARFLVTPNDYVNYRLYEGGKGNADALQFLSSIRAKDIQNVVNREPKLLQNKLTYDAHYSALGLPIPKSIAVIAKSGLETKYPILNDEGEFIRFISKLVSSGKHLVIKEVSGKQGAGVLVIVDLIEVEGYKFFLLSNGATKRIDHALKAIFAPGAVWLVQERLDQHCLLKSLNPTSLNTMRLGTFRNQDGSVEVDYAALRIGRPFSQVDAFAHGGLVVKIDEQTGMFARMGFQKPKYSLEMFSKHPDSGIEFEGTQMPFWDQIIDLAKEFATHAGNNKMVGWDVAVTPEGPVFVEGNHHWDAQLAQAGAAGLVDDEFLARLEREAGLTWSSSELPKLELARCLRILLRLQ